MGARGAQAWCLRGTIRHFSHSGHSPAQSGDPRRCGIVVVRCTTIVGIVVGAVGAGSARVSGAELRQAITSPVHHGG